jgi:hypothetical protein
MTLRAISREGGCKAEGLSAKEARDKRGERKKRNPPALIKAILPNAVSDPQPACVNEDEGGTLSLCDWHLSPL